MTASYFSVILETNNNFMSFEPIQYMITLVQVCGDDEMALNQQTHFILILQSDLRRIELKR